MRLTLLNGINRLTDVTEITNENYYNSFVARFQ